ATRYTEMPFLISPFSSSCELALAQLSVLSAWRFTHTLRAETRPIVAATTISSHGTHRCQPVDRAPTDPSGDVRASASTRRTSSSVAPDRIDPPHPSRDRASTATTRKNLRAQLALRVIRRG